MTKSECKRRRDQLFPNACVFISFLLVMTISAVGQNLSARRPANVPQEYVVTPFGYMHPSCLKHLREPRFSFLAHRLTDCRCTPTRRATSAGHTPSRSSRAARIRRPPVPLGPAASNPQRARFWRGGVTRRPLRHPPILINPACQHSAGMSLNFAIISKIASGL